MSTNNTQAPQGVTGNTHTALNGALGTTTTSFRGIFRKDNAKWWGYALITSFLVVMVIGYTASGVQFAGLILTGLIALYIGNNLRQKPDKSIGALVYYAAIALIAGTVIASDLGQAILGQVNKTEEKLAVSIASLGCIDRDPVVEDGYFTLRKECENQSIETPAGFDPRFHIEDRRFPGASTDWVAQEWDKLRGNTMNFTHLKWPEGVNEVQLRMVSVERAAKINAAAAKKTDTDYDRLLNTKPSAIDGSK